MESKNLFINLYKCIEHTFTKGNHYKNDAVTNLLKYQSNENKIVKAHVIKMNSDDSKRLFQETFVDCGNTADQYLIYIWQIYEIYEVKERDAMPPSLHCITEVMVKSGKYAMVVPARDMKKIALTDPNTPGGRYYNKYAVKSSLAVSHPFPDLDFEWTDFRIGVFHSNGVVFLINSPSWENFLQEISASIEGLEVKRFLKFLPSLGSTFGLKLEDNASIHKKIAGVLFIRVRVVSITQAICQVYGIDSGSFHQCNFKNLVLLPASIIKQPPSGRLAKLPVIPIPLASPMAPTVAFMAELAQETDLLLDFHSKDVQQMSLWLQVKDMECSTLTLLKALTCSPAANHLLSTIALVTAEHLLGLAEQDQVKKELTPLLISILTLAMQDSPQISLMLVRRGIFITLCEAALTEGSKEAWKCLRVLLDGEQEKRDYSLSVCQEAPVQHPALIRKQKEYESWSSISPDNYSNFPVQMSITTTSYHKWEIALQPTMPSPQLASYSSSGNWHWDQEEVMSFHTGILEIGHNLGVSTDLTHHIIQERNVSSICSETLLQIVLGMLNTHLGGKIYIGLSQLGIVQGVKITRDQKDSFMLGITKLLRSDIHPSLLPCDSHIQFIPVVQPGTVPQSEFIYYLAIFTIEPEPHQVYFSKEHPEKLYIREGGVTLPLHGSHQAKILSDYQIWTQELEEQVIKEQENLLKLAQSKSQHW